MKPIKIALTHASGLFTRALLEQMAKAGIKADALLLLDNAEQAGDRIPYADTHLLVQDQAAFDYEGLSAVFLLEADAELQDLLQHANCYVISHHGPEQLAAQFVADSSAAAELLKQPEMIRLVPAELATLLMVLLPLHQRFGLQALQVVNVLSASFHGQAGVEELASQTVSLLNSQNVHSDIFPLQLAFNVIPFDAAEQSAWQLADLLGETNLEFSLQQILVPAFHGLAIAVTLRAEKPLAIDDLISQWRGVPGIEVVDNAVSPLTHCKSGLKIVLTSVQHPQNDAKRLQFWIIADSIKNGLIQNYLHILDFLLKSYL